MTGLDDFVLYFTTMPIVMQSFQVLINTGVACYHVQNYDEALIFSSQVLKKRQVDESIVAHAKTVHAAASHDKALQASHKSRLDSSICTLYSTFNLFPHLQSTSCSYVEARNIIENHFLLVPVSPPLALVELYSRVLVRLFMIFPIVHLP